MDDVREENREKDFKYKKRRVIAELLAVIMGCVMALVSSLLGVSP